MVTFRSAVVIALAVVLGWSTPASAQSETVRDHTRDTVLLHYTHCNAGGFHCRRTRRTDPTNRVADVVWARHVYTRKALTLTMKVRNITRRKTRVTYLGWDIAATHRQGWLTQILYYRGHTDLTVLPLRHGHSCPGAQAHVALDRHLYRLTLPTACLGTSRWVRISGSTYVMSRGGHRFWYDDPRQGSELTVHDDVAQELQGPRLYRG